MQLICPKCGFPLTQRFPNCPSCGIALKYPEENINQAYNQNAEDYNHNLSMQMQQFNMQNSMGMQLTQERQYQQMIAGYQQQIQQLQQQVYSLQQRVNEQQQEIESYQSKEIDNSYDTNRYNPTEKKKSNDGLLKLLPKRRSLRIVLGIVGILFIVSILSMLIGDDNDDKQAVTSPQNASENTYIQTEDETVSDEVGEFVASSNEDESNQDETQSSSSEFDYGDMHVKYLNSEIAEDAAGNECLVVYFEFTNNSDKSRSFGYTFTTKAYQNGIEMDTAWLQVNDETKAASREIQPGTTITVGQQFALSGNNDEVNIQMSPFNIWSDRLLMDFNIPIPN